MLATDWNHGDVASDDGVNVILKSIPGCAFNGALSCPGGHFLWTWQEEG